MTSGYKEMNMAGRYVLGSRMSREMGRATSLGIAALLVLSGHAGQALAQGVQPNIVAANQRIVIHAVMPNPASGLEWVELVNESELPRRVFLPIVSVTHDGPAAAAGSPSMLMTTQPATAMSGWQLGNGDSAWYGLPPDLPPAPYGARVVVYFDGQGPDGNDYDFSDGLAVLHTPAGLVNVFNDTQGKAILYAGAERTAEQMRSALNWKVLSDE
jgi:hypothetical protein